MNRGRGVTLQKYKDGGLSDARVCGKSEVLTWQLGEKTRTVTDLKLWIAKASIRKIAAARLSEEQ